MKKLVIAAGLSLLGGAANATTLYLAGITYENSFVEESGLGGVLPGTCLSCVTNVEANGGIVATATYSGAATPVTVANLAWIGGLGSFGTNYTVNDWDFTLALGSSPSALAATGTLSCTNTQGTWCTAGRQGIGATGATTLYNGYQDNGTTADPLLIFDALVGDLDPDTPGDELMVRVQRALTPTTTTSFQAYRFYFSTTNVSTVPVPGAVWLLGSAVGLLGWLRRRATA